MSHKHPVVEKELKKQREDFIQALIISSIVSVLTIFHYSKEEIFTFGDCILFTLVGLIYVYISFLIARKLRGYLKAVDAKKKDGQNPFVNTQ